MPHGKTRAFCRVGVSTYRCDKCDKTYNSKHSIDLHNRYSHSDSKPISREFTTCGHCKKPTNRARVGVEGYCKCCLH